MNPKLKEALFKYYSETTPFLPEQSNRRQYCFILWNGKFIKIRDRINKPEDLQKHLVKYLPRHVYFSTSRWLDPTVVGPRKYRGNKAGYKVNNNLFLGSELYFDFDGTHDEVYPEVVKLIHALEERYDNPKLRIIESGNGYHVWFLDWEKYLPEIDCNGLELERKYSYYKKNVTNYLMSKGIKFDMQVTEDTRRIIRLPNTIHGGVVRPVEFVYFPEDKWERAKFLAMTKSPSKEFMAT